ncbi:hypothetical protein RB195_003138 [Necator americanus]|uniref:Uncharacterized protein n=1 Tax=Necator americanus TaxID=51031 RepID=A0ABR1DMZ8_NECAM
MQPTTAGPDQSRERLGSPRYQAHYNRKTGRPPTRWSDFFTKSLKEKCDALRVSRERRNHWATLARDRDKWKNYWRPLDQFEDQRKSR